ncbi:hypothetical protein GJAV_G00066080 [Gymnothorax javanicus]|nr:hypothetical protein GJAV_G00066080 [Gymnothorax javanicus]
MPRKKKSGQSPARAPGQSAERGVIWNSGSSVADQAMARNESKISDNVGAGKSTNVRLSSKEEILNKMQEMFSHLDPEVIYLVLNECDFRAEHAMDALLELSETAEGSAPEPTAVSGFELAAALLFAKPEQDEPSTASGTATDGPPVLADQPEEEEEDLDAAENCLTEEFDSLIDQEMESLSAQPPPPSLFDGAFPPFPQEGAPLPELLLSSVGQEQRSGLGQPGQVDVEGSGGGQSGTRSLPNGASFQGPPLVEGRPGLLDFSHLTSESLLRNPTLELGNGSRPSAFQAYKKSPATKGAAGYQFSPTSTTHAGATLLAPGSRSGLEQTGEQKEHLATPSLFWNTQAPEFHPQSPALSFITPVVLNPSPWGSRPVHHWFGLDPAQQAPLKPAAKIPKSWAQPAAPRPSAPLRNARLQGRVLVLLRGAPGSGKSTLARNILIYNPSGVVLSSDEFFCRDGRYSYNPALLGEAHEWNHCRAKEAFEKNMSPIIIDNTNMQCWEMKPYVALAKRHNYKVMFREPDTWWKFKPKELERRTQHGVTKEKIRRMLERYDRHVSVDLIMRSSCTRPEPGETNSMTLPLPETSLSQPSEVKPDLVEEPHLNLGSSHTLGHAPLFSSLPDVSSVGRASAHEGSLGAGSSSGSGSLQGSSVSLPVSQEQVSGANVAVGAGQAGREDSLDTCGLDWELDNTPTAECTDQWEGREELEETPEYSQDSAVEQPTAFSESIGQRLRRDRARLRQTGASSEDGVEQLSGTNDFTGSPSEGDEGEGAIRAVDCDRVRPELLDFVGDWPVEGMEQREQRPRAGRGRAPQQDANGSAELDGNQSVEMSEGSKQIKTEFQKLLDLLQIDAGAPQGQISSSASSPIDFALRCSSENLSKGGESVDRVTRSPSPSKSGLDQKPERDAMPELLDSIADWTISDLTPVRDTPQCLVTETPPPSPSKTTILTPDKAEPQKRDLAECETSPACRKDLVSGERVPESPGGAAVSPGSRGSQERRHRQSRRSGKQCKLALTFTSPTSPRPPESPLAALTPVTPTPLTPVTPTPLNTSSSVQTEPQDFALLWRLDRRQEEVALADHPDKKVLVADCTRFQPGLPVALEPAIQQVVPYRVMHDKGTQVVEEELMIKDSSKDQELQILSRHFKRVSYDTLEDLYNKCHQDIEWTTNLLLDSGEELFREDDDHQSKEEEAIVELLVQETRQTLQSDSPSVSLRRETPILLAADQPEIRPSAEWEGSDPGNGNLVEVEAHPVPEEGPALDELTVICKSSNEVEDPSPVAEENLTNGVAHPEELSTGQSNGELDTPTQLPDSSEADLAGKLEVGFEDQDDPPQGLDLCYPPTTEEMGAALVLEEVWSKEPDDLVSLQDGSWSLVSQLEEVQRKDQEEEQKEREQERARASQAKQDRAPLSIQSLELKLPAELAFQLSELFGPVGIPPGSWSPDDCLVQIDLNLARLLHQKWKETIQERQRQEALSYHLLQESSEQWGESLPAAGAPTDGALSSQFLLGADGFASLGQSEAAAADCFPFMDHWNARQSHTSLRDIMLEEQALQEHMKQSRESRRNSRRDGATLLKEKQLYAMFPNIDRHFLNDMFKDHNYSLEQTTQFLSSLLDEEPVKTVVAQDTLPPRDTQRSCSNEGRRKGKEVGTPASAAEFQDTQDPDYEDFRTEATLQRRKQQECFSKAAEAYRQGMKDVASFYAQQGHLHGQKMREANHRAAMRIFQQVNATLLPQNILDLHGLHVDEALYHLQRVLEEKTAEWQQGGCRPQLSVITGRGNHSQGGVARIRPAVIDYLSNHEYTFTEPKRGLVLVTLH